MNSMFAPQCSGMARGRALVVSAGGTATPRKRIVLIDATNVLARSFSSPSEARRIKPRDVFRLWTEYLASSADVVVGVFDNPGNQGKPGSVLFPFRSYLESRPNSMMVTSALGQEADGAIVNIAQRLEASAIDFDVHTYVASGDSDLQACLAPNTSWMEILPYPTKTSPGGLVIHGLEDFRWRSYFTPSQYGVFLALRGKEAVKGVGLGERTAAKLVRTFGTVEKMLEAGRGDAGLLTSWDVSVRRALTEDARREQLATNAAVFEFLLGTENDAVADKVAGDVAALVEKRGGSHYSGGENLHPMFSLHLDRIRLGAKQMMEAAPYRVAWGVAVDGWYVDALIEDRVCVFFVEVDGQNVDETLVRDVVSQALDDSLNSLDPFKLRKRSAAASMARYLALLKHCPHPVLLLPIARAA